MLRLGCCALPRQGWRGGGASNPSLPGLGTSLGVEDQDLGVEDRGLLTDTPTLCPPAPHARFSALHHAALGGSLELIALLLEAQATVDIKDSNGETAVCPCLVKVEAQPRPMT